MGLISAGLHRSNHVFDTRLSHSLVAEPDRAEVWKMFEEKIKMTFQL